MRDQIQFSLFTKPWRTLSVVELGKFVKGLGFDGIEFPLRDGYQLTPDQAHKLPELVRQFGDYGLKIFSVASQTDEKVFAGCAEAGIPMIRIMPKITMEEGYLASEERVRKELSLLMPLCEKYGVKIGVQQHYGNYIVDCTGVMRLIGDFDPSYIGAVWDAAHDALAGQQPEFGLDLVWSHLCMVNFKNAFYRRVNGPEAEIAEWKRHFTTATHGLASWPRAVHHLKKRNYEGVVCLTAEYTDEARVGDYIRRDIDYAKSLFC